jgi:hypothetical protein
MIYQKSDIENIVGKEFLSKYEEVLLSQLEYASKLVLKPRIVFEGEYLKGSEVLKLFGSLCPSGEVVSWVLVTFREIIDILPEWVEALDTEGEPDILQLGTITVYIGYEYLGNF